MGQYHLLVNLDKHEFIDPHQIGDGLKVWEQIANGPGGVGSALLALLAVSNGRGGGDLRYDESGEIVGRWGGDRIALVGDYAEDRDLAPEHEASTIYNRCRDGVFNDITSSIRSVLARELDIEYPDKEGWIERRKRTPA